MKTIIPVAGLALLLAVIVMATRESQQGNLFVRPNPNDPHPIAPKLPEVVEQLALAKSQAESRAQEAIQALRRPIPRPARLQEGRRLYDSAKAQFDGLIEFLCTGLETRFAGIEPAAVDRRLVAAQQTLTAFLEWNVRRIREDGGPFMAGAAGDLIQIGVNEFMTWIKGLREADQQVIDRMIDRLEKLHLSSWDQLSQ